MSDVSGNGAGRKIGAVLASLVAVLVTLACIPSSSMGSPPKQLLVLHSYHTGYKWTDDMTQGITAALQDESDTVKVHNEYMDCKRVSDPAYLKLLYETYKYKFSKPVFDVIIAADRDAFDFLISHRDDLFPGTPVVFCGLNYFEPNQLRGAKLFTGVNSAPDIKATIDLALKIHPFTHQIVVINDVTTTGRIVHNEISNLIPAYQERVKFLFLEAMEMPQILAAMEKLRTGSLVLYTPFFGDNGGNHFEHDEGIDLIAGKCPVPIYGVGDFYLGNGIVGGMLTSGYYQGETAGRMAALILHGEKVENLPVIMKSPNRYMFDYLQIEQHHIEMSSLPAGSIFINKPSSRHSVHHLVFWGVVGAMAGSALIIVFLLNNARKRWEAEQELRDAAIRYRIVADNAYNWEFWLNPDRRFMYVSPSCQRVTGHAAEEFLADSALLQRIVHPDDRGRMNDHWHEVTWKLVMCELEFRIIRQDGNIRWIHHVCQPVFDDNGKFLGTRSTNSDITGCKQI